MNSLSASPQGKTQWSSFRLRAKAELERRKRQSGESGSPFAKYIDNPVGFGVDVLGEEYTDDQAAIMESVRDNPVTVARSSNAVGKTHCAARIAAWFYLIWEDAQVYTTAAPPMDNLRRLLWGEIGSVVNAHPDMFGGHTMRTMHIERGPQSFISGVAIPTSGTREERESKFSGKHAPHLLFIVDEGDAVPDEVYRGIESCMSGGHARLLVMFNPRAQAGPVWIKERDRQANIVQLSALDHPNVVSGEERIPGAVTRGTVVGRINRWSRSLADGECPDNECFEVPGFLVGETAMAPDGMTEYPPLAFGWRKVTNPALSYMVFGEYPAAGANQLINRAWLANARSRWDAYVAQYGEIPPEGVAPVMGLDVADGGQDRNAICFRYGGWVARLIAWGGVDADAAALRAKAYYDERGAEQAQVDGTGVGAGVAPRMRRLGANARKVMVGSKPTTKTEEGEFYRLRDQLWWAVREWLRTDPGAALPPDEELLEELAAATYGIKGGEIKVMDKPTMRELLKRSPDKGDSLCLTFALGGGVFLW